MNSYIDSLSNGIDTITASANNNLSGGEKQKRIARTLLKNYEIIIFDEPMPALDKEASERLLKYINQIKPQRIIFFNSQSCKLIEFCDKVIEHGSNNLPVIT